MSPLTESTRLVLKKPTGSGWTITPQTKVPVDPQYGSVSLLLHGNADGSGNILDSSPTPKTISKFGNAASATPPSYPNSNSAFGNAIAFDGSGDYVTAANNSSLDFGSGDFTVECWVYLAGLQALNGENQRTCTLVAYGTNGTSVAGYQLTVNTTTNQLQFYNTGVSTASFTWSLNTWYHVAYTRSSSTNRLFVDGQSLTLTTNTFVPAQSASDTLRIGAERKYSGYNNDLNGYIDDLRITKGIARYTSNFTPPAAPFPDI
jgi:hypothetical protein